MAFPFKTGGDFYNCEAQRMRLHNLGANPTETATGLMYFNTGTSNLGKHAVVHDGTNFKALAFVDEIASNTAFTELANRVLTIEKALGEDTANVIDTWEEIQNFLKDIDDNDANLMTMLNSKADKTQLEGYLPLSGGHINGNLSVSGYLATTGHINLLNHYLFARDNEDAVWVVTNRDWSSEYTLIHSGNYATEIKDYYIKSSGGMMTGALHLEMRTSGTVNVGDNDGLFLYRGPSTGGVDIGLPGDYYNLLNIGAGGIWSSIQLSWMRATTPHIFARNRDGENYGAWKELAFTDSDITGNAAGLKHSNGTVGAVVSSSGNVLIGNANDNGGKLQLDGYMHIKSKNGYISLTNGMENGRATMDLYVHENSYAQIQTSIYGTGYLCPLVLNPNGGNVGIGTTDPQYKLDVNGTGRFTGAVTIGSTLTVGGNITPNTNDIHSLGTSSNQWSHLYAVGATLSGAVTIKGDLVVEGNIIGKKEVSAGGAGQEGESGAGGGAEVISQTLASGASSYTIANTIKRSDIAVSLYEWNASGNSWDMCLADISVTASTITVTFGSATTVNHKLVAVG